jgi:hypothetical protein
MKQIINKVLLFISILAISNSASAQDFIEEDMMEKLAQNASPLWDEKEPAFSKNDFAAKYKEESGVILGWKRSVTIDKKSRVGFLTRGEKSLLFDEIARFKIKLNDKAAVKVFTEIYFRYADKNDGFAARLYKPDGKRVDIDLKDAVSLESKTDVPEFYKSFFDQEVNSWKRYFKMAIPDLEIGDVLEYVTVTKSKLDVSYQGYVEFSAQYELCNKNYPILFNQIIMETDNKSYFKSMAFNGAPEFKKESTDDLNKYVFTDIDRGVSKDVDFINQYKVYPLNKFQVIYSNKGDIKGALIGEKAEIKKGFTMQELGIQAWESFTLAKGRYNSSYDIKPAWNLFKKEGAKSWTNKEYADKAYYHTRNIVLNRDSYIADYAFVAKLALLFEEKDIPYDVFFTTTTNLNKTTDVLFEEEMKFGVRAENTYYFNTTDYSNPNELREELLGQKAYIIFKPEKNGGENFKEITLPNAVATDNNSDIVFDCSLSNDKNNLAISRVSTYKGIQKTKNIADALRYTSYVLDDYKYFRETDPLDKLSGNQSEEYYKSVQAFKQNNKEYKPKFVKQEIEKEYSRKIVYKDFTLISDGRSQKNKDLKYKEDFELPGMVRKAGKKLLVNLSGLVGSQLQIKNEQRDQRTYDIDNDYARSLFWIINFKIPEGYTASGLTELNTEVSNETGTYACQAQEANGQIVIKIKKIYKEAIYPKAKWADMIKFVDAAYNNSFKYILLKPKS